MRTLAENPEPLPPASRQMVGDALVAIARVMNCLEGHYRDTEVAFTQFIATNEAESMLCYLDLGLEAENLRRQRLSDGRPLPEDLGPHFGRRSRGRGPG